MTINIEALVNEVEKNRKEDDNMKFSMDQIVDRPVNNNVKEKKEINSDELGERMRAIKIKKENEKIGKFSYYSTDEMIYGTYQKKMESNVSIQMSKSAIDSKNSNIIDKENKYIYDGYVLRLDISECPEIDKLKCIFTSFKKLYRDGNPFLSLEAEVIEVSRGKFFELQVCFTLCNDSIHLEEIDNKIEEVKMEIENILRIFEIYHYDVNFQFYSYEPSLNENDNI